MHDAARMRRLQAAGDVAGDAQGGIDVQPFLALQPRGTINQSFIRVMGPDLALHSGIYTFDVVRDGKPEQVTARFDYLYRRINGRWLIANHHSSKMPEPVAPGSIQTAAVH